MIMADRVTTLNFQDIDNIYLRLNLKLNSPILFLSNANCFLTNVFSFTFKLQFLSLLVAKMASFESLINFWYDLLDDKN